MKVLLINPNRYRHPPVPPIGLEYIAGDLAAAGHQAEILDLCFCEEPYRELDSRILSFQPDAVGITLRNIDTVLYPENEFFLDDIRSLVAYVKDKHHLRVAIGGAALAADPEGLLEYTGADSAVCGPGEGVAVDVLTGLTPTENIRGIYRRTHTHEIACLRQSSGIDYQQYAGAGGIAGFETHKGCSSSCIYCTEADTRVSFRRLPEVISEIRAITDRGFRRFHLCDSEFNEDLDYALDFLKALKASGLGIDWTLYLKPSNHNRKMFQLMRECGVSLITMTVDSWKKCPLYWGDIEKIIFSARSNGIKVFIDFLTGFPYEQEDTVNFYLDLFRRLQPDSVGINTYLRLYRGLKVTEIIARDPALQKNVIGSMEDERFLKPVFYNQLSPERLEEMIRDEPLFRIEGAAKGVNYSR